MSVVGNEAGHGRPASGRRFERRQGWRSKIKRTTPPGGVLRLREDALRSPATGDTSELLSADAVTCFAVFERDNVGKHFVQSALPRFPRGPRDVRRNDQVSQPCFD